MVDLFVDDKIVEAATRTVFLADCARALRPFGLFIMNVYPADRATDIESRLAPFFVTFQRAYGANVVITGMRSPAQPL